MLVCVYVSDFVCACVHIHVRAHSAQNYSTSYVCLPSGYRPAAAASGIVANVITFVAWTVTLNV